MRSHLDKIVVTEKATVTDAIRAIDSGAVRFAIVVNSESRLVATITDGDVRRGILRGVSLNSPVTDIMHRSPMVVRDTEGRGAALKLIREAKILGVPVVDAEGRLVGLELIDEMVGPPTNDTWVVLMASSQRHSPSPPDRHVAKADAADRGAASPRVRPFVTSRLRASESCSSRSTISGKSFRTISSTVGISTSRSNISSRMRC